MVRAWIAESTPLYERECYERYYRALPDFRRKKADALRSVEKKAQSVGVWALWAKICEEYGLPEGSAVNFSHSGKYVMCAAADSKKVCVGCDLEKIGVFRENVAKRFFCPEEYETIMKEKTEDGRAQLFYRYWVLKESFMKATGRGMAHPANASCIRLGEPPVLIRQPAEFSQEHYYMEYKIDAAPYKMAVCSTDKEIDVKLHMELKL